MPEQNQRQELERLRKLKRLRELEAKASGGQFSAAPTPQAPVNANPAQQFFTPSQGERSMQQQADMWAKTNTPAMRAMGGFAGGYMNGVTLGNADNLNAAVDSVIGPVSGPRQSFSENKADQRQLRQESRENAPVSSMAGEIAGFLAPGGLAGKGLMKVGSAIPQAAGRGAAYAQRLGGLAVLGGAENALYQGTVGASNREAEQGRDISLAERGQMAVEGGTDPVALAAGPAFSLAYRGGRGLLTGNVTPDFIKKTTERGGSELGNILEGTIEAGEVSPDGIKLLGEFLRRNEITLDDDAVMRLNSAIDSVSKGGGDALSLPVRLKDILVESLDGGNGQFKQAVETQLRGTAVKGGAGANTVLSAVDSDMPAAREFVSQSLDNSLGNQSRLGAMDATQERLKQIGREGYEPMLKAGPVDEAGAEALRGVLDGPGMSKLYQPLETIAAGEGVDLATMLAKNPLEAAHWMQSKARQLSARSSDNVTASAFTALRKRLLSGLDSATGGQYNKVRKQYGDEFGNQEALEFGDRFLTKASKDLDVDMMAREFGELSETQQEAALLSVRDALKSATGRGTAGSAPRLTRVREEQVLDALRRVFGDKGDEVAQNIQKTEDFVQSRRRVDPRALGSPTAPNQEAVKTATNNVQSNWRRRLGGALEGLGSDSAMSSAFGAVAPLRTVGNALSEFGKVISGNPDSKLNALAELLEAPVVRRAGQSAPTPPSGGQNALANAPSVPVAQSMASTPVQAGAGGQNALANTAIGAGMGGLAPADSNEERLRNMVIGGGLGAGASRLDRMMRSRLPQNVRTNGVGGGYLPMDEASRMARAKAMGFDTNTTLYHGTNQDLIEFDPARFGLSTQSQSAKEGVWLTDSSEVAGRYADNAAQKTVSNVSAHERKVKSLLSDIDRAERSGNWDRYDDLTRQLEDVEINAMRSEPEGANIMPLQAGLQNPMIVDAKGGAPANLPGGSLDSVIENAKALGHDGVIFRDMVDTPDGSGSAASHYLVFDPSKVRSVNAKFDPRNADSKNLLAASPFVMAPSGLMLENERQKRAK